MKTHPQHDEIVAAIKAMPLYSDPQNIFEDEISECYEDSELVESFGWEYPTRERGRYEKALTPAQAVKAVQLRCEVRQSELGWQFEEAEKEKAARWDDEQRDIVARSEHRHD